MNIHFGLNLSKNKNISHKNLRRNVNAFVSEENEENNDKSFENSTKMVNKELSLYYINSSKNEKNEEEIDSSIYAYDEIYDEMKEAQKKRRTETDEDKEQRKPKYMDKFFELASVRERDRLRAQEKMLQIERQAEGDMYKDKEKFVTEAYKKQQEELSRLEEEENRKEALMRKKSKGIESFYLNMLNQEEEYHNQVIEAISKSHKVLKTDDVSKEKTLEEIAKELNEKGINVTMNDDGEVVDKRQLLSAGLNIVKKSTKVSQEYLKMRKNTQNPKFVSKAHEREKREKEIFLIQEQIKQMEKEREEEERRKYEELVIKSQKKRSAEEINKIKERYLKRKAESLQDF
ncbi:hypothetical protein PNEG_02809 [Pneumocystis murina B123]|uniref:Nuclear speckle splicing regulatory protein 1 N-terminal domain-containing protein n=1 Tax=Pneumocystis murina (strain B123) TaxID=1069680 RepID=M7NP43_PNEMU|nr:hypothetical protein PNEG_02809 [Pneumocystis murina B123]EMR09037.1 hypothetical protein PNEG_02809 [Pneumocystis murina B123]